MIVVLSRLKTSSTINAYTGQLRDRYRPISRTSFGAAREQLSTPPKTTACAQADLK